MGTRYFFVFLFFLAVFGGAAARLVYLQVFDAQRLSALAEGQRVKTEQVAAQRGTIYDRSGQTLAVSVVSYDVFVDPALLESENTSAVAELLASKVGGDALVYGTKIAEGGRYQLIARRVTSDVRDGIEDAIKKSDTDSEATADFKKQARASIGYEMHYARRYPNGTVGAQVLGYVGGEDAGASGIELNYERALRGLPGSVIAERDTAGNEIPAGEQFIEDPVAGTDLVLTIDLEIQYKAQEELASAVEQFRAKSGSVIVMNPQNGEIYASASYPFFDPNKYGEENPAAFHNRAFTDAFEPGSTFKSLTLAGALERGSVEVGTTFAVPHRLRVGTRTVSDHDWHPTENMTVSEIIEISSNTGTTKIAQKMGERKLYDTLSSFGIGQPTGLDYPTSAKGILPELKNWSDVSLSNISFGQGVSVTAVQLVRAVAAIANGGKLVTPHLLKAAPADPSLVGDYPSEQVISGEAARATTDVLTRVMTRGTGKDIDVVGYTVAGKTGTAQKAAEGSRGYAAGKYVGSFIGYLPAENPSLIVFVALDEPTNGYYGSLVAGRAFENIATFAASHLGITPGNGGSVLRPDGTMTGDTPTDQPRGADDND